MLKQNLFIILSGIIAGAAIFGWMKPNTQDTENSAPTVSAATTEEPLPEPLPFVPIDLSDAASAFETSQNAALKALASAAVQANVEEITQGTKRVPKLKLVSPEIAPSGKTDFIEISAEQVAQKALEVLKASKDLQNTTSIAIFNAADGKLIAETDGANAQQLIDAVKSQKLANNGYHPQLSDSGVNHWSWQCIDKDGKVCVAAAQTGRIHVEGDAACRVASSATRLICQRNSSFDGSQIFEAQNCGNAQFKSISEVSNELLSAGDSGIVNHWNYKQKDLGNGCVLLSGEPVADSNHENTAYSVNANESSREKSKLLPVGIAAVGSALFIIIIGFVCTRRKEDEQEIQKASAPAQLPNDDEIKKLQSSIASKDSEIQSLQEKVKSQEEAKSTLDRDYAALQSKNTQLQDQLDYARKMHQSHTLTIETLEAENEELKDKLASVDKVSHTQVQIVPKASQTVSALSSAAFEDISEKRTAASTRPLPDMSPALADALNDHTNTQSAQPTSTISNLENVSNEEDLFPDDGWDEIASSFDAILVDKNKISSTNAAVSKPASSTAQASQPGSAIHNKTTSKIAQALNMSDLDLLENEEDRAKASLFGMTAFLNGKLDNTRASKGDTTLTPSRTTSHGLGAVPSQPLLSTTPKASSLPATQPVDTLKRIPSLTKAPETKPESVLNNDNSFKPSPSWTGKKAGETQTKDAGAISQELVSALQRRAKDVSQLNAAIPHDDANASTNKSGALDFSRTMSKSGAFSVTGSRAAIRINSDTEYFKVLYNNYLESLRQHGEDTSKFTREQFISRMAKEKEALIKKYKCKDIRFEIVDKNGKTSLKAVPLR